MMDTTYHIMERFFVFYTPLLFSLCVHEWAHARMALIKGDMLAYHMGRLSLNPMVHADLIGTVLLPLLSIFMGLPVFGWAKPVPVDVHALKNPRNDMFWIALAGPLSNFCLSFIGVFLLAGLYVLQSFVSVLSISVLIKILTTGIYLNLLLGFFNLIPLHPLDGGKVLARFLPAQWNYRLEEYQQYTSFILIALFVTGSFKYVAFLPNVIFIHCVNVVHWLSRIFI